MSQSGISPLKYYRGVASFPLLRAVVDYEIVDVQYSAIVKHKFKSGALEDLELVYNFPLPPDSSVCSYRAVINHDRVIEGVIKSKEKAKKAYDNAIKEGKTATYLQQVHPDVFQISLGNVKPKQTMTIQIGLVGTITHQGGFDSMRINFPVSIAPRYGIEPTDVSKGSNAQLPLEINVSIEMTAPITAISSPSHTIQSILGRSQAPTETDALEGKAHEPRKAHVSLTSESLLKDDFILVLNIEDLDKPRCTVESFTVDEGAEDNTDAYALTLTPRFKLTPIKSQEYIFLVDRSGSMDMGKMRKLISSLQIMIKSLPTRNTLFNVLSFGDQMDGLWTESVPYAAHTVETASTAIEGFRGDYGGTEMRRAVEGAIASKNKTWKKGSPTPTVLFIMTDGEAWDLEGLQACIQAAVEANKVEGGLLRVFVLGIGRAASRAMCEGMARAGQGVAVFVREDESPDQKLMAMLHAARGQPLENISIDWGIEVPPTEEEFEMVEVEDPEPECNTDTETVGSLFDISMKSFAPDPSISLGPKMVKVKKLGPPPRVQVAPALGKIPSMYAGFRTSIHAIVQRSSATAPLRELTLRATSQGNPISLTIPVTPFSSHPVKQISSKAEKGKNLDDGAGYITPKILHVLAARELIRKFEDAAAADPLSRAAYSAEVERLGLRYGVASSRTSFVAIDERSPNMFTGSGSQLDGVQAERARYGPYHRTESEAEEESDDDMGFGLFDDYSPPPASVRAPAPARASAAPRGKQRSLKAAADKADMTVEEFARRQTFEGSFRWTEAFSQLIVKSPQPPVFPTDLALLSCGLKVKGDVWKTVLCLAFLERTFGDKRVVWMALEEKANDYLDTVLEEVVKDEKKRGALLGMLKAQAKEIIEAAA